MTSKKIKHLCSDQPGDFNIGDRVVIREHGTDDCELRGVIVEVGVPELTILCEGTVEAKVFNADNVKLACEVSCTQWQVQSANLHAVSRFPGARILHHNKAIFRRMSAELAEFVASFLRSPENVEVGEASMANSKGGGKNKFKVSRCETHRKLCTEMLEEGLAPVSYGHFYNVTKDYEILTADNCCCGSCRDMGMYNFIDLRAIIEETTSGLKEYANTQEEDIAFDEQNKELLTRTVTQEKFLSSEFFGHLKQTDGCGSHCLAHLLTTHNNPNFCKPCIHPRDDDAMIPPQVSMAQYHQKEFNRNPR